MLEGLSVELQIIDGLDFTLSVLAHFSNFERPKVSIYVQSWKQKERLITTPLKINKGENKMAGNDLLFHTLRCSTIGAGGLNVRVRDGIVCTSPAPVTSQSHSRATMPHSNKKKKSCQGKLIIKKKQ